MNVRGVEQLVVACLNADDIVLLAESEGMLQRIVDEFDKVCKRRKLKNLISVGELYTVTTSSHPMH